MAITMADNVVRRTVHDGLRLTSVNYVSNISDANCRPDGVAIIFQDGTLDDVDCPYVYSIRRSVNSLTILGTRMKISYVSKENHRLDSGRRLSIFGACLKKGHSVNINVDVFLNYIIVFHPINDRRRRVRVSSYVLSKKKIIKSRQKWG